MVQKLVLALIILSTVSVEARNKKKREQQLLERQRQEQMLKVIPLEQAVRNQQRVGFSEGHDLKVVEVLADDLNGLPHQKFNVELPDGSIITVISNLDMCEYVPVKIGDLINVGGEYIPSAYNGAVGIIHWVHFDPKKNRLDGFIELDGERYCQDPAKN